MFNLPDHGYTPSNYAALVELTQLSNADFYRTFNIAKNTFYHHHDGTRTMKWQEWQALLANVTNFIRKNDMRILAEGTIYQLREQFGLDSSAGIEDVEQTVMNRK